MNESHDPATALSAHDAAHPDGGPAAAPSRPQAAARPSGWTAGRIAALVIGALLVLFALVVLGGAPYVVGFAGVALVVVLVNAAGALADLFAQSLLQLSVPRELRKSK